MQRVEEGVFSDAIAARAAARSDIWAYASLAGVGLFVAWLSATRASILPSWAPWDFSAPAFVVAALASWWYLRGIGALDASRRPSLLRRICYFAGVAVTYAVVQTRFEYMAQHMFVLNRIQHVTMHHLGPMLVALAWPGAALKQGMPRPIAALRGACRARFDCAPGSAPGAGGDPVCRPDFLLADPADSFSRDDRPRSLLDDELEHDRRRRAVLEPRARSATVAARKPVVRGARRARSRRDISADRRRRRDRVQPRPISIPTTISVAGYILHSVRWPTSSWAGW